MRLSVRNLAFSWSEAPLGTCIGCNLLLLRWTHRIDSPRSSAHSHPFWQMELVTAGEVMVRSLAQTHRLSAGDAVLLPPRVQHQFIYEDPKARFMSFSFGIEGKIRAAAIHPIKRCPFLDQLAGTVQSLLPDSNFPDERVRRVIAALLASVLSYAYTPATDNFSHLGPLFMRTCDFVRSRNGGNVTVQDVANHLGYTANYTSTQFHRLTGESLKRFLDRQRTEKARDLLRYTNLSVTQIARALEFNDVFSFSRYFHRVAGISPRRFRRQEQQ